MKKLEARMRPFAGILSKSVLACLCLLAITPSVLAKPSRQGSKCGAPTYKIAQTYSESTELRGLAVSINPRDATVHGLLQLACAFREDFPSAGTIEINIFNDFLAAKRTDVHGVEDTAPKGSNKAAFIAYYYLNRKTNEERLTLVVDPGHPCGHDIDINLKDNTVSIAECK